MRTYRFPKKTGYPPILQNDILVLKPMVLRILHFKKPPNMGVSYASDPMGFRILLLSVTVPWGSREHNQSSGFWVMWETNQWMVYTTHLL